MSLRFSGLSNIIQPLIFSIPLLLSVNYAWGGEMSGTFVGKGTNGAFLMQIVSNGNFLTGRYEQVILKSNGVISDTNATVSGQSDQGTVVLTIMPAEPFGGSIIGSGTFQGDLLHISGGGHGVNIDLSLTRADEKDFRIYVSELYQRAERYRQAVAAQRQVETNAKHLANVRNLTHQIIVFAQSWHDALPKINSYDMRYTTITQQMNQRLVYEQGVYGGWQMAPARSDIYNNIMDSSQITLDIHSKLDSAYQSFDFDFKRLNSASQQADHDCNLMQKDNSAGSEWNVACFQHFHNEQELLDQSKEVRR